MQYEKTINKILSRLSNEMLIIEIGDILETQKTIFPKYSQKREEKNIIIESTEVTPPLACSKEWKKLMLREKAILCQIYKDFERGDILKVKNINGSKIVVENLSIDKEFRKEFEIDRTEIFKKNFSLVKRRSVDLVRKLEKLDD